MRIRGIFLLSIVLLLGIFLSACTGVTTQEVDLPKAPTVAQGDSNPTQEAQGASVPTGSPAEGSTEESVVAPTEEPQKPELKTGLVATDPVSVNLTSGKPTLVEFFAFW